jgi:glycosyltransferase involved in cell wall biosynthesis
MRRVLMVAFHYPPESSSSGVLRTLKFSKYLPEFGWVPTILTVQEKYYDTLDTSLTRQIPENVEICRTRAIDTRKTFAIRGKYSRLFTTPDRFVGWLPFALRAGKRLIRKHHIDALYSTSPLPSAHLIAKALKSSTHLPWVADFRDPWTEPELEPNPKGLRFRLDSALERSVLRSADRLVFTTTRARNDTLRHVGQDLANKSIIIPNGYDEEDFRQLPHAIPERFPLLITHTGLVDESYRSPLGFLHSLAELITAGEVSRGEVAVQFIGGGHYVESAEFGSLLKNLRLEEVVRSVGRMSYAECLEAQIRSHILLLLQCGDDTRYAIPGKAFEYLRIGRPILAIAPESASSELFHEVGGARVVDPKDAPGLTRALRELLLGARQGQWKSSVRAVALNAYSRRAETGRLAEALCF